MRQLIFLCGGILFLLLVASGLAVKLPPHQAVAFTIFGACIAGMILFTWNIAAEEKRRHTD